MKMVYIKDHEFAVPPNGAIVEWRKSGAVWAYALLSSGVVVRIADYDKVASIVDHDKDTRHLMCRAGYGASWISPEALIELAKANIKAIEAERNEANTAAERLIAFYEAHIVSFVDAPPWSPSEPPRPASIDGWVSPHAVACHAAEMLTRRGTGEDGENALAAALLRRGKVFVAEYSDERKWRLTTPELAGLALFSDVAMDLVRSCNPRPQYRGMSCCTEQSIQWLRATDKGRFEPFVDHRARERATWESVL